MKKCLATNLLWYWLVVVLALFGVGCGREPEPAARPEIAATIEVTRVTLAPTEVATAIPSATTTATAELSPLPPPTATFTPEPTSSPTSIVLPTMQPPPPGLVYNTAIGVWMVNRDSNVRHLYENLQAELSPDGNRAVYWYDGDIWVANLAADQVRNLTQTPTEWKCCPQWWPGRPDTVLFRVRPEGSPYTEYGAGFLAALDVDGSGYQILDETAELEGSIALSPDGQSVVYNLDLVATSVQYHWGGEKETILTSEFQWLPPQELRSLHSPAWSPAGTKIAWVAFLGIGGRGGRWGLVTLDLESRIAQLLFSFSLGGTDMPPPAPVWSSDGQWLALQQGVFWDEEGELLAEPPGLWMVRTDGSGETIVLEIDSQNERPNWWNVAWSPDGRWLAFTPEPNEEPAVWLAEVGTWQVYRVPLPGGEGVSVRDWLSVAP
jgi:hypothetical protein